MILFKRGKIPVEHRVIWEFGAGAGINAIWQGEWKKRWFSGYEWLLIIDDNIFEEPYTAWKPVKHILYNYDVARDLKKYKLNFKK